MKEFIINLLSGKSNDVSSRRFTAFISLLLFIVIVVCSLFGVVIQKEILYATVSLITTSLGLTLIKNKSDSGSL